MCAYGAADPPDLRGGEFFVALERNADAVEDDARGVGAVEETIRRRREDPPSPRLPSLPRLRRDNTA